MARFSLRIVDADFYLAKPVPNLDICYSQFRLADTKKVPVVRIFGATASGQKTCLHLHQLFPYIYVPVSKIDASDKFAKLFATSLDFAIQIALGKSVSNTQHHVYEVALVKGFTFYGFHDAQEDFLKISVYNPHLINQIEDLLLNGAIMGRVFQPYEGHIPFLLQFFIDYNLYGMNYIHLASVKFRQPILFSEEVDGESQSKSIHSLSSPLPNKQKKTEMLSPIGSPSQTCYEKWRPTNLTQEMLVPASVPRQSCCCLEVDAIAADILNKDDVKNSLGSCPGLNALWQEEKQRRMMNNESTDISAPVSQEKRQAIIYETERKYLENFRNSLGKRLQQQVLQEIPPSEVPFADSPNLISDSTTSPEDLPDQGFDDSQPIVDEDAIRHSVSQATFSRSPSLQASAPNTLWTTLDEELVDILMGSLEEQDSSVCQSSSINNGIEGNEVDAIIMNGFEKDDMNETILMSQHVYDDVDNDDNEENAPKNNGKCSSFDEYMEDEFSDSWTASMINDIPQIDGTYDIEDISRTDKFQAIPFSKKVMEGLGTSLSLSTKHVCHSTGKDPSQASDSVMLFGRKENKEIQILKSSSNSALLEPKKRMKSMKTCENSSIKVGQKPVGKQTFKNLPEHSKTEETLNSSSNSLLRMFSSKSRSHAGHDDAPSSQFNKNSRNEHSIDSSHSKFNSSSSFQFRNFPSCDCGDLLNKKESLSIPQIDGSSDSDFREAKKVPRRLKTPLKTYGKSSGLKKETRRTRLNSEKLTRESNLENNSTSRRKSLIEIMSSRSGSLFGHRGDNSDEDNVKRVEINNKGSDKDIFSFSDEDDKQQDCSLSCGGHSHDPVQKRHDYKSNVSSASPEQFLLSPEKFYSSSKRTSFRRSINITGRKQRRHASSFVMGKASKDFLTGEDVSESELSDRLRIDKRPNMIDRDDSEVTVGSRNSHYGQFSEQAHHHTEQSCQNLAASVNAADSTKLHATDKGTAAVPSNVAVESHHLIRDCYVRLVDLKINQHSLLTEIRSISKSEKRKPRLSLSKSAKKARFEDLAKFSTSLPIRNGNVMNSSGLSLGGRIYHYDNECNSCSDYLFKSQYPSPDYSIVDALESPPRANSPSQEMKYTKLISPYEKSTTLEANTRRANDGEDCNNSIKVRFQNDKLCTHIKPVRLNFDCLTDARAEKSALSLKPRKKDRAVRQHLPNPYTEVSAKNDVMQRKGVDFIRPIPHEKHELSKSQSPCEELDASKPTDLNHKQSDLQVNNEPQLQQGNWVDSEELKHCVRFSPNIEISSIRKSTLPRKATKFHKAINTRGPNGSGRLPLPRTTEFQSPFSVPQVGDCTLTDLSDNSKGSMMQKISEAKVCCFGYEASNVFDTDNACKSRTPSKACNDAREIQDGKSAFDLFQRTVSYETGIDDLKEDFEVERTLQNEEANLSTDKGALGHSYAVGGAFSDLSTSDAMETEYDPKVNKDLQCLALPDEHIENFSEKSNLSHNIRNDNEDSNDHRELIDAKNNVDSMAFDDEKIDPEINASFGSSPVASLACNMKSVSHASPTVCSSSTRILKNKKAVESTTFTACKSLPRSMTDNWHTRDRNLSNFSKETSVQGFARIGRSSFSEEKICSPSTITKVNELSPVSGENEDNTLTIKPAKQPPSCKIILDTAPAFGLGETRNKKAFFSDSKDVPSHASNVGGRSLRIRSIQAQKLPCFKSNSEFQGSLESLQGKEDCLNTTLLQDLHFQAAALQMDESDFRKMMMGDRTVVITPCRKPPPLKCIKKWLDSRLDKQRKAKKELTGRKEAKTDMKIEKDMAAKVLQLKSPECIKDKAGKMDIKEKAIVCTQRSPSFSPACVSPVLLKKPSATNSQLSSTPLTTTTEKASFRPRLAPGVISNTKLSTPETAKKLQRSLTDTSQIEGPTPKNDFGFGFTQVNYEGARNAHQVQHLTILSMELHIKTRRDLCPDPGFDPISAIFYHLTCDTDDSKETGIFFIDPEYNDGNKQSANASIKMSTADQKEANTTVQSHSLKSGSNTNPINTSNEADQSPRHSEVPPRTLLRKSGVTDYVQRCYSDEKSMILAFQSFVRSMDPDMLLGYEIQMLSWGYLIDRAKELDIILCPLISRIPGFQVGNSVNQNVEKEAFLYGHANEVKIVGRILLNVWRIMRSEVTLRVYSFENVAFHVLHRRLPKYTFRTLSSWWNHQTSLYRWRVVEYYVTRCRANYDVLERTDFISRTSELARIFGILFYSVISRGSQFRVESMMLRIAKPMGYIPVSPSVRQRALMSAPEVIPLVMEPESRFYTDPVIVLDFQSLYPSIIIAYNYCFSTCLGRVKHWDEEGAFKFGATSLSLPTSVLEKFKDAIHVSPNGVGFIKSSIRKGILPRMLDDILKTRIMVKNSMKKNKDNKALHRMLDARQLGLKLIANVTYGYTSANFSGRMPCVEIADSVVRKGREALESAISLINSTERWNAKVVYGDTDSVFILMKGATKKRAFDVANEIVEAVTKMNPQPMKLKFEKVYMPCILQTKKRYIGYMYETPEQKEPVFDAKGIETVRRDSCAAVSKILERSLKTLFETKDLSLVKRFVQRQFTKILEDRVSVQDFTFAKEYRGMKNYKPGACVPALAIARRLLTTDKRAEPRTGERVPYVVVYGTPGLPLIQLVKRPEELFEDSTLRLNGLYYITKQIVPSLSRALSLIGVDVLSWFKELPRPQRKVKQREFTTSKKNKGTISQYFSSVHCPICGELTRLNLCSRCLSDPQNAVTVLSYRIKKYEQRFLRLTELCYHCTGSRDQTFRCVSQDCPIYHKLYHVKADTSLVPMYRAIVDEI